MGLRIATSFAAPELLPLLSALSAGGVAGVSATSDISGAPNDPKPQFEGSTALSVPSASQILSAVMLLASLALLASLPLLLRRELSPPRRRPL